MCLGLGLLERLTGARAARRAQQKEARMTMEQSRLATEANQNQLETNIAQQKASQAARDLLDVPIEDTTVTVGDPGTTGAADPTTGRRRNARSRFQMSSGSGLAIP